jgi:hypothetical protein
MISLNLAISTAVMAMKLQLVTDAETFCKKKVDTSFIHDKRCYMSTHALATEKELKKCP